MIHVRFLSCAELLGIAAIDRLNVSSSTGCDVLSTEDMTQLDWRS
ncbi:MAG: hypothetical protein Q613_PSC00100G0001, partial [Propionibacterium sp. DORA_15]